MDVPNSLHGICTVDVKQHLKKKRSSVAELGSCVKVEVAVPGSRSLTDRTVSVDVKQH